MALGITILKRDRTRAGRLHVVSLAFDSSYPTGGEVLTPDDLEFERSIDFLLAEAAGGYTFEYDHTNGKLIARYGDNNNAADAPGVEVAGATDLSAVTGLRALVYGDAPNVLGA